VTVKEFQKEIAKEKFDVKNTPLKVKLPTGETYDVSMVSIYDDMAVIEVVKEGE
jgi:hypothetical protein